MSFNREMNTDSESDPEAANPAAILTHLLKETHERTYHSRGSEVALILKSQDQGYEDLLGWITRDCQPVGDGDGCSKAARTQGVHASHAIDAQLLWSSADDRGLLPALKELKEGSERKPEKWMIPLLRGLKKQYASKLGGKGNRQNPRVFLEVFRETLNEFVTKPGAADAMEPPGLEQVLSWRVTHPTAWRRMVIERCLRTLPRSSLLNDDKGLCLSGRLTVTDCEPAKSLFMVFRGEVPKSVPGKFPTALEPSAIIVTSSEIRARFAARLRPPPGLLLVTGRTGSGKTTLIAGLLHQILLAPTALAEAKKGTPLVVVTLEDPDELLAKIVEFDTNSGLLGSAESLGLHIDRDGSQELLGRAKGGESYTMVKPCIRILPGHPRERREYFDRAIMDALRQTPALLFIGELRDRYTWKAALRFALTGHLVVATAHAGSVTECFIQLFDVFGARTPSERAFIAQGLLGVLHQKKYDIRGSRWEPYVPSAWWRSAAAIKQIATIGLSSFIPRFEGNAGFVPRSHFVAQFRKAAGRLSGTDRNEFEPLLDELMKLVMSEEILSYE